MSDDSLGPNGGVLYALEELEHNIEWLENGLGELGEDYVLFDCPGQVELFTHHASLRNIFFKIQKLGYRVCFSFSKTWVGRNGYTDVGIASGASSSRFILLNATVALYLESPIISTRDAADGSTASKRPHENR